MKNENSLVERIKKLTCDLDDEPERCSPPGEESKIPAYRKITDLFRKDKEPHPAILQVGSGSGRFCLFLVVLGNTKIREKSLDYL